MEASVKLELLGKAEFRKKRTWPGAMLKAKQRAALVAMRMSLPTTAFPPVIRAVGQALLSLLLYVLRDQ